MDTAQAEQNIFLETCQRVRNIRTSLITKGSQTKGLTEVESNVDRALLYSVMEVVAVNNDIDRATMMSIACTLIDTLFDSQENPVEVH